MQEEFTGFADDDMDEPKLHGLYIGEVTVREDPERLGRIRVAIPGICEPDSAWALPKGAGHKYFGGVSVPPLGAMVYIQFVNGDIERPVYEKGWIAKPKDAESGEQVSWAFPEHTAGGPDVHVWGLGPVRLIVDDRDGQRFASMRVIKEIAGAEETIVELKFDVEGNSCRLYATTAVKIEADGLVDIDCAGDMQVKGRKVMPTSRPVN